VDRVKPYANQAIRIARPVVLRTHQEWNHRVVPQWNKVVVPQFRKYIVPQYHKYLTPQLERVGDTIRPYFSTMEGRYESLLGPYVRFTISNAIRFQRAAQPYILVAADKTYSGYQSARPYMHPVWQYIKLALKRLLGFLRSQRRQLVDPHVAKIWERVKELSRGDGEVLAGYSPSAEDSYMIPVETSAVTPSAHTHTDSSEKHTSPSLGNSTPTSTPSLTVATFVPGSSQSVGVAVDATSEIFSPATSSGVESIGVAVHSSSLEVSTPLSATIPSPFPSAPPLVDEINLDTFYADIGLFDEEPEMPKSEPAPTQDPPLSAEQLEELRLKKLAETAEKRRDITGRHSKWEAKLDKTIKEQKKSLRKVLVAMRKAAEQELRANTDVKSAINQLVENAEKLLKGAEAYLASLKKESRPKDEKAALWTKLLGKVDAKFTTYLPHMEGVVNRWYTSHLDSEREQVS